MCWEMHNRLNCHFADHGPLLLHKFRWGLHYGRCIAFLILEISVEIHCSCKLEPLGTSDSQFYAFEVN